MIRVKFSEFPYYAFFFLFFLSLTNFLQILVFISFWNRVKNTYFQSCMLPTHSNASCRRTSRGLLGSGNDSNSRSSHWRCSLKSDSHLLKKSCDICFIESPLNIMKNAFYFILKALFVLQIFKFLSLLLDYIGKTS